VSIRRTSVLWAFLTAYVVAATLPASSLWFAPGQVSFVDARVGDDPVLVYDRVIKRATSISYYVIIRDALTTDAACEGKGGPILYEQREGSLLGKTLSWWVPQDPRCKSLPESSYYGYVTWTIEYPLEPFLPEFLSGLKWLLPPKTVTREIPLFSIIGGT
jgi:hypothetical protein